MKHCASASTSRRKTPFSSMITQMCIRDSAYRDELQGKIDIIQQQLDILVQRINELDAQIEQGEQDIADTRISINANYTKLKKRLRALYMAGEASNLSILLSSTSLVDYTQKSEVIQSVTKHDTELLDTLEEQLTSIQEQVEKINADKEEPVSYTHLVYK